jgi:hypothetical protein
VMTVAEYPFQEGNGVVIGHVLDALVRAVFLDVLVVADPSL